MKSTITSVALLGLVLSFLAAAHIASASVCYTANGCTGTSSPSGILYGDNGSTSHLNTVTIGSGLTFSAGTLSTSGGGITQIGPAGQLQSGSMQTIASSTSSFNGLTDGLTITASGNTQTFQPTLSGTLNVAGGGTGNATYSASQLLYGNGTAALSSVATSTLTCTGLISCTSTTIIGTATTISFSGTLGIANGGTNNATAPSTNAIIVFDGSKYTATSSQPLTVGSINATTTATSTYTGGLTVKGIVVPGYKSPGFTTPATSTWTGTTTYSLPSPLVNDKLDGAACHTDAGTLNVQIGNGTASTTMFNASTTQGFMNFTSNNTFNALTNWFITIGTPASSPTSLVCTFEKENTSY